jgi:NurA-like 5'-3' nuclease
VEDEALACSVTHETTEISYRTAETQIILLLTNSTMIKIFYVNVSEMFKIIIKNFSSCSLF